MIENFASNPFHFWKMTAIKRLNFGHFCIAELPSFQNVWTSRKWSRWVEKVYESGWAIHFTLQNGNGLEMAWMILKYVAHARKQKIQNTVDLKLLIYTLLCIFRLVFFRQNAKVILALLGSHLLTRFVSKTGGLFPRKHSFTSFILGQILVATAATVGLH